MDQRNMDTVKVKTILMDVDGTMTRLLGAKPAVKRNHWTIFVDMVMKQHGLSRTEAEERIKSYGNVELQCISTFLKPLKICPETYFAELTKLFSETIEIPEDTLLFFRNVKEKGIPLCTATTNPPFMTHAKLSVAGIASLNGCEYLTRHHSGNEFDDPLGKFSPHFFPNILRHHGYDPAYTMMIGDEPKRDLYPALEAGIRYCVIIDRSQTEDIVEKDGGIFIRAYSVLINKIKNTGG